MCLDVALFQRAGVLPARKDHTLNQAVVKSWIRQPTDRAHLVYGPSVRLGTHPETHACVDKTGSGNSAVK